jgi:hypothetical protein
MARKWLEKDYADLCVFEDTQIGVVVLLQKFQVQPDTLLAG